MSTYSKEEMEVILANHKKWWNDEEGGERADLSGAYTLSMFSLIKITVYQR